MGIKILYNNKFGTSFVVQWLRNPSCNSREESLMPGWGTKIPHAAEQLAHAP